MKLKQLSILRAAGTVIVLAVFASSPVQAAKFKLMEATISQINDAYKDSHDQRHHYRHLDFLRSGTSRPCQDPDSLCPDHRCGGGRVRVLAGWMGVPGNHIADPRLDYVMGIT